MTMFWFFLQIGKIQPQKYLSMTGSVSSLMQGGGEEEERGEGGGEKGNSILVSRLDPASASGIRSGKHTLHRKGWFGVWYQN